MNDSQWENFIADSLSEAGKKINPPQSLLAEIITKAAAKKEKSWQQGFSFIFSQRVFVSAGTIMILLAVFFSVPANFHQTVNKTVNQTANINQPANVEPAVIPASPELPKADIAVQDINNNQPLTTDDVDAAVIVILASAFDEDSTLTNDVGNESWSDNDSAAINNLIQTYDQDQL
jgi:hypothetical protein